ncbi:ABC transporter permease [Haliea sp. E1-2-M8]|uniref:MlaE family ABC transporter permease n=1 Tax=Haliea sp. E1-2-M8 TaxID=3064706 RepID=UPI00271F3E50|nr:ABC transporter permease [Haliea sp. E1-2-M8]MDO8861463.1 ABC transporter permease [Haliea sp. E1-2-M8]
MSEQAAGLELRCDDAARKAVLHLCGNWIQGAEVPSFPELRAQLNAAAPQELSLDSTELGQWDSLLMALLLQCHNYCREHDIELLNDDLPENARRLLRIATSVPPQRREPRARTRWWQGGHPLAVLRNLRDDLRLSLAFFGDVCLALWALLRGRANTRFTDFRHFCYQAGPDAFAIISLTSILVGMILGYLGAVQLQQFGAGIYVADLVVIGLLREMGVLMTAIVMAGRTGAAYAAQLGTMQASEEIDAVRTMGVSPIEFLVTPRILALVVMMPLLTIYANLLGILGGGIVAGGMGISPLQYISQASAAISLPHIGVGLLKSVVFAILIAIAGCRSGIQSGRDSAGVGQAATEAVVTALVYLIVADAAVNILFQHLGV